MLPTIAQKYGLTPGASVVVFDPVSLTAISMASTAAGTIAGAAGSMTAAKGAELQGTAAQQASQYQAAQLNMNSGAAIASGQRRMLDTQQKTRLLQSSTIARAGASGVNAGVGSPQAVVGDIAKRGSYSAAMDLWKGENEATGLENQAQGTVYTGDVAKEAAGITAEGDELSAAGTIAGGMGSLAGSYGRYAYPQMYGRMA